MPAAAMGHLSAIRSGLQSMHRNNLNESSRRVAFATTAAGGQIPRQNPIEARAADRPDVPTDFTRALGLIDSLRTQIRQDPVSSLATASAHLDQSAGARQILSQIRGPESA